MSSGEDWTHQWLNTNMGPSASDGLDDDAEIHNSDVSFNKQFHPDDPLGIAQVQAPDEGVSTSPVTSIDLDRDSPMACEIDDDDVGPPSIESQPPDHSDMEVSGITTTWLKSGTHFDGAHPELGYSALNSDLVTSSVDPNDTNTVPNLEREYDTDGTPIYGPSLPSGHLGSPLRELSPIHCGDVADESATSGLCGLRNLGNTCFMAAGLQCLVNTPPIAQYFFNHNLESDKKSTLAGSFSQLTHKIWSGKYSSLRPQEFKEAFGAQWRDFRDYRQHDCQEFMTLLLEGLRKQMLLEEEDNHLQPMNHNTTKKLNHRMDHQSCTSSVSSRSSSSNLEVEGGRGSRGSLSPSPPQSPQCPPSPISPDRFNQPFENRSDTQEDAFGLDSGPASPKSSISSGSVDAHLISLRLQPIPEEVKTLNTTIKMDVSPEDVSAVGGTANFHDAESITSDISDFGDGVASGTSVGNSRVAAVRKYNHLAESSNSDQIPVASNGSLSVSSNSVEPNHCKSNSNCDSSSSNQNCSSNATVSSSSESVSRIKNKELCGLAGTNSGTGPSHLSMVKLEDIMKETKTSNVNVLAKDNWSDNEFLYDSEKYAKCEAKRINNSLDNLGRSGLKRVKEVNILVDKMDNSQIDSDLMVNSSKLIPNKAFPTGRNTLVALNKRIRLEEKNIQYELDKNQTELYDRLSDSIPAASPINHECTRRMMASSTISSEESQNAMESWKTFVGSNKSAVVDTFYGQFKNSLICSVCGHTSVRFEPFGTLSVPLPHANEIQIPIVYIPHDGSVPTRYLVTLFKVSTIQDLKIALLKLMGQEDEADGEEKSIIIAEVFDNHIARTVDESYSTKFLNTSMRSIYAFESAPHSDSFESCNDSLGSTEPKALDTLDKIEAGPSGESTFGNSTVEPGPSGESTSGNATNDAQWQACNICLEELCQTDLKTHDNCEDCVLCDNCIEMSCKHHGGISLPCPVCHTNLEPCDLIPVVNRKTEVPKARILRVAVVFRIDTESDDNNKREMQLIGHPCLLSLPSRIYTETLKQIIKHKIMNETQFSLLLVDGRGYNCSRCLFSSHCRGCDAVKEGAEIVLQAGDTLCVRLKEISALQKEELGRLRDHQSMSSARANEPLTLYDCLRAFSQSEVLKENESWFCPKCEKKQSATKTISVWKYPPYLIIHLERFLFHGTTSVKLDDKVLFPIDGLDLSDFVTGEQQTPLLYNLYSCVCHMGIAQAGHYTALVRSPVTSEWHYFNDDCVTRQKPRDEEYSTSYLLFYHRQGNKFDLSLPKNFGIPTKSNLKNIESEVPSSSCDNKSIQQKTPLPSVSSLVCSQSVLDNSSYPNGIGPQSLSHQSFGTDSLPSPVRSAEY